MTATAEGLRLDHDAFVYDSDDGYVATLAPMMIAALEAGDDVQAVVPLHNAGLLRRALPPSAADEVTFIDSRAWYRRPGTTITQYDDVLKRLDGRPAFVVGEVEFGTTPQQWVAWTRYESVLNRALARHPAHVICPYDRRRLPEQVVDWATTSHPHVVGGHDCVGSAGYLAPDDLLASLPPEVEPPQRPADRQLRAAHVRGVRQAVHQSATSAGFGPERTDELVLGVNEIATNALIHGGGRATVRLWSDPGVFTCTIADRGPGLDEPFAGYLRPEHGSSNGYGLWLARQVFDLCSITRAPLGGVQVTLAALCNVDGVPEQEERRIS